MLGPNGAGKTTLFGIITGMLAPNSGRVLFDGSDITPSLGRGSLPSRHCALVSNPAAFRCMTAFENLVVAGAFAKGRREREVYDLSANPRGLRARRESQRQGRYADLADRKRLELARALATRPKLLLLDEVAGGLSEMECETLVALIRRIRATGVSVIWIEQSCMRVGDGRPHRGAGGREFHRRRPAGSGDPPSQGHGNLYGHSGQRLDRPAAIAAAQVRIPRWRFWK